MKIIIKLEDPKSCTGCPCLFYEDDGANCNLYSYYENPSFPEDIKMKFKRHKPVRLKKCIDERGL